ncbi:GrpB family protein [Dyadobacter flavalbus]|uniref:GrpB family protein n=1 Tax=Dyadobacter flavalbus TaxID=2579942 RepID=A0A5M8QV37_9BACT|nr:GrpB family protein [Dyadobacter flavalbus]
MRDDSNRSPSATLTNTVSTDCNLVKRCDKCLGDQHYHIGPAAVPGLAAKDIIDSQVPVSCFDPEMKKRLNSIGFTGIHDLSDHRPPGRDGFDKGQLFTCSKQFVKEHQFD